MDGRNDAAEAADGTEDDSRVLDAREVDGPPFDAITAALADLDEGETLVLVNSFEPEPLYGVLETRGFAYETTRIADDEWRVTVEHA